MKSHSLPPPTGNIVNVSTEAGLWDTVNSSPPHTTILLTDALTGTATAPYLDGVRYWALKSQNAQGDWSALSNTAFWPRQDAFLPIVLRGQ